MKKFSLIGILIGLICLAVGFIGGCTAGLSTGMKVAKSSAEQAASGMGDMLRSRIAFVDLGDDLVSQRMSIMAQGAYVFIDSVRGSVPDRVTVDYIQSDNGKRLGDDVIYVQQKNGGKVIEINVPKFDQLVVVKIHR